MSALIPMKNIAHFATGLALASFVPGVMLDAARGSLLIALGGACAMLPDTLDFKLARYLERRDAEIAPDAATPDPQAVADQVACQIALAMSEGRPRVVQLHPTRRSAVEWVPYTIRFDVPRGQVVVIMDDDGAEAKVDVGAMDYTYDGDLHVEELGGPSLRFSASGSKVRVEFLPWHRMWTHSLVIAAALGLLCSLLLGPSAGAVAALGYAAHVFEDELGYMGSNLWAPFTRKRGKGLGLFHSGDAIPNVVTIWLSVTLLLLNMDRIRSVPLISPGPYLAFAVLLPSAVAVTIHVRRLWRKWKKGEEQQQQEARQQGDIVADTDETQT